MVDVNIYPIQISKPGEPVVWILKENCIGETNDEMQCSVQYIVTCAVQTSGRFSDNASLDDFHCNRSHSSQVYADAAEVANKSNQIKVFCCHNIFFC